MHFKRHHPNAQYRELDGKPIKFTAGHCRVFGRTLAAVTNVRNDYFYQRNAKAFPCTFDGCLLSFNSQYERAQHEASHHIKMYKYRCPLCFHLEYTDTTMRQHLNNIHGYKTDYISKNNILHICKIICSHETQSQPQYNCDQPGCDFQTESSKHLIIHQVSHESAAKNKCQPCNSIFPSTALLQQHVNTKHSGSKLYICGIDECPKSFDTSPSAVTNI